MVTRLAQRQRVTVVADQVGAPTSARLLADVTGQLLVRYARDADGFADRFANGFAYGLYHVAAAGRTSWYGYARHIAGQLAAADVPLAPEPVQPVPSSAWPARAPRPRDTRLDTTRLQATFGVCLPAWQDEVADVLGGLVGEGVIRA